MPDINVPADSQQPSEPAAPAAAPIPAPSDHSWLTMDTIERGEFRPDSEQRDGR
jgi:hypothetical protein